MPRCIIVALLAAAGLNAAIWPEQLGPYKRKSVEPASPTAIDSEYGLEAAESADYGSFQVTAFRFKDATGAYAAWLERPSSQVGNYVVACTGRCPKDLPKLAEALPGVSHPPLPNLHAYLYENELIPRSERYILGPLSLKEFAPQIPEAMAAFQFGPEGQVGHYRTTQGEETLAIFSYPTPQMARKQAGEFQKLPGALVKRSGPIVGIVTSSKDPVSAERLLSNVHYHASLSWDEPPPVVVKPKSIGNMMLGIFELTGILLVFCVLSGLAFGGYRMLRQRLGPKDAQGPMILLHLSDK